jgi:hypothetical protein
VPFGVHADVVACCWCEPTSVVSDRCWISGPVSSEVASEAVVADVVAGVGAVAAAAAVAAASVAVDNASKIRSPEAGMFRTTRTGQCRW